MMHPTPAEPDPADVLHALDTLTPQQLFRRERAAHEARTAPAREALMARLRETAAEQRAMEEQPRGRPRLRPLQVDSAPKRPLNRTCACGGPISNHSRLDVCTPCHGKRACRSCGEPMREERGTKHNRCLRRKAEREARARARAAARAA